MKTPGWVDQTKKLHDGMKIDFVCDADEEQTVFLHEPSDVSLLVGSRELTQTG